MTRTVPFPHSQPPGYEWLSDEVPFDADRHLALEPPSEVILLGDLGYTEAEIEQTATKVAASAPFRILSEEGAAVMLDVARRLRPLSRRAGDRIENTVRGGCYRSRWLRDLCLSPDVTELLGSVYGVDVAPHSMPLHLGHLNFEPTNPAEAVDKWHHDTLALDYVMMVTDPATLTGGRFEYFFGTRSEAAELAAAGERPPPDRIVAPEFGGPGWAIALHGNMVVHRGAPLSEPGERITMVNGYVARDTSVDDQSRHRDLMLIDDPTVLYTEWVRHVAWRARSRLDALIDGVDFDLGPDDAAAALEHAVVDIEKAVSDLRAGPKPPDHYE